MRVNYTHSISKNWLEYYSDQKGIWDKVGLVLEINHGNLVTEEAEDLIISDFKYKIISSYKL